jgi:hypothetical protein
MGFFDRMAKGWEISMSSYKVLLANKQLIIFPVLSGLSMLLVMGSFLGAILARYGWDFENSLDVGRSSMYLIMFFFYIVNYLIIVFFNMALMHCAKLYFDGEEVTITKGLKFSASRLRAIFTWAVFAATVGIILRMIQDNAGWLGKIVISLVGFVWSLATFFVIPVIAYEDMGPVDALKKSADIMKNKWGERLGASFSFAIIPLLGILCFGVAGAAVSYFINEAAGIILFVVGLLLMFTVTSALNSIFISAVYNNINGNISQHFHQQMLDGLFEEKGK